MFETLDHETSYLPFWLYCHVDQSEREQILSKCGSVLDEVGGVLPIPGMTWRFRNIRGVMVLMFRYEEDRTLVRMAL